MAAAGRPEAAQIHAVHAGFVRHGRGGCGAPCPPSWLLPDGAWATEMVMSAYLLERRLAHLLGRGEASAHEPG